MKPSLTLPGIRARIAELDERRAAGVLSSMEALERLTLIQRESTRKSRLRRRIKTYRAKAAAAEAELNCA